MRPGRIFAWLSLIAGVATVIGVAYSLGTSLSDASLVLAPAGHALALAAFMVHLAMRALRVVLVARGLGVDLTPITSTLAQLAGDAAGAVTPSRIGCDPAKMLVLARAGVNVGAGAAIMMGEILVEVAVLVVVAGVVAFVLPAGGPAAAAAFTYAVAVVATTSTAILIARAPDRLVPPPFWRCIGLSEEHWRQTRAAAAGFLTGARGLLKLPAGIVGALFAVTFMHMAARIAVLPLLLIDRITFAEVPVLLAWPMLLLYAGALVPAPGGGGAIELVFAAALDDVLSPDHLVAALLWWRFYTYYLSALLGAIVLASAGTASRVARSA